MDMVRRLSSAVAAVLSFMFDVVVIGNNEWLFRLVHRPSSHWQVHMMMFRILTQVVDILFEFSIPEEELVTTNAFSGYLLNYINGLR